MKDIEIHQYLKYEESQGRPQIDIKKLWEKAKDYKRESRQFMHLATCHPIIEPQENRKRADAALNNSVRLYKKVHEAIELNLILAP